MNKGKRESEILSSDHSTRTQTSTTSARLKSVLCLFLIISFSYITFAFGIVYLPPSRGKESATVHQLSDLPSSVSGKTNLSHIVFGIAASAKLWNRRKNYIKLWWRPNQTRGIVWLDKAVNYEGEDHELLPSFRISENTLGFRYTNPKGDQSAVRISRIVSETLRLGMKDVRWFVMGDDDTFFVADNLLRTLQKYDHNQFYYIGSSSESHFQNIRFSYNMAYGGAGFAISYPLAKELEKIQDRCIERYPSLYGSDERIHACMAELGVPLTKEKGFHQIDIRGDPFGLLAAHPIAPLVSLHHLDRVNPIFPNMSQIQALERLNFAAKLDSAALMQQSICYDKTRNWTVSVSWGYAVQIFRGMFSAREIEMPARTFLNWKKKADDTAFAFKSRPLSRHPCQKPFLYYLNNVKYGAKKDQTTSEYVWNQMENQECRCKMADPSQIKSVEVYKKVDPHLWTKQQRRNCCRILETKEKGAMAIAAGECRESEIIGFR